MLVSEYVEKYLSFLQRDLGFQKIKETFDRDDEMFDVLYELSGLQIRIERYWRTIQVYVGKGETEVALLNLLEYLQKDSSERDRFEFCSDSDSVDNCYRLQFEQFAQILKMRMSLVSSFFEDPNYIDKVGKLREYMIKTYPHLFKRSGK